MIHETLKDFGQSPTSGASILVDRTRLKRSSIPAKTGRLVAHFTGSRFFIGKSRLWLAERAKCRGSHGGAPENGFKPPTPVHDWLRRRFLIGRGKVEVGKDVYGCN